MARTTKDKLRRARTLTVFGKVMAMRAAEEFKDGSARLSKDRAEAASEAEERSRAILETVDTSAMRPDERRRMRG